MPERLHVFRTVPGDPRIPLALAWDSGVVKGVPAQSPQPAPLDDSQTAAVVGELSARLRAGFPAAFAGIVRAADGDLEVYSTGDPNLLLEVQNLQADRGGGIAIRVVTGATNSLAVLERLQEDVRVRNGELRTRGIVLGWGIDVRRNRLRLEVVDLTAEKAAFLKTAFGAARVEVVEGQLFAPSTRATPQ